MAGLPGSIHHPLGSKLEPWLGEEGLHGTREQQSPLAQFSGDCTSLCQHLYTPLRVRADLITRIAAFLPMPRVQDLAQSSP